MTQQVFDLFNWHEAEGHAAEIESLWQELDALTDSAVMRRHHREHARYMENYGNSPEGFLRQQINDRTLRRAWWYQYDRDVEACGRLTRWRGELDDDVKALFPDYEEQNRRFIAYLDAAYREKAAS